MKYELAFTLQLISFDQNQLQISYPGDLKEAFERCKELVVGYLGLGEGNGQTTWVPSIDSPSPIARSDSQTPIGERSITPLRSTSGMKTWSDRVRSAETNTQMSRKLMSPGMKAMLQPQRSQCGKL